MLFDGGSVFAGTQQVPAGPQQQAAAAKRGEQLVQGGSSVAGMTAVLSHWAGMLPTSTRSCHCLRATENEHLQAHELGETRESWTSANVRHQTSEYQPDLGSCRAATPYLLSGTGLLLCEKPSCPHRLGCGQLVTEHFLRHCLCCRHTHTSGPD